MTDESEAGLGGKEGELQVELFTRNVLVGVDMQWSSKFHVPSFKYLLQFALMKGGGTGDGNGLVACGEQRPAVGTAFGNVERFSWFQMLQNLQIVDVAFGTLGETETRSLWFQVQSSRFQVTPLDSSEVAVGIVVRRLEPVVAVAILPGGEAAPADDAWVEPSLIEEEPAGGRTQVWMLEVTQVA